MIDRIPELKKEDYLLRIPDIVKPKGLLPISRSTFWKGVKSGKYPQPIKLGPKITCWKWSEINNLINNGTEAPFS